MVQKIRLHRCGASGAMGKKGRDRDQKEEERDENETPMIRTRQVLCLSDQIGCDKQTDARAGGDNPESQAHIFLS